MNKKQLTEELLEFLKVYVLLHLLSVMQMEEVINMKKNKKGNGFSKALGLIAIIMLVALYLGYKDGRYDKNSKQCIEFNLTK